MQVVWVIADDGSLPREKCRLQELASKIKADFDSIDLMHFENRSCKGGAIYQAWDHFPNADWLAFVDADGAVSAESMLELIHQAMTLGKEGGVIGVRHHSNATPVHRGFGRKCSFYLFRSLMRCLVDLKAEDTQCGAKVIPARIYRNFAAQLQERGFIFDVELLILLNTYGANIIERRISWAERSGGKIRPGRDVWGMLAALLRIRRRKLAGEYEPT